MAVQKGLARPYHRAIPVPPEVALRVDRFVRSVGERVAVRRLGVGKPTLEAARDNGSMLPSTYTRLLASLVRCEAEESLAEVGT